MGKNETKKYFKASHIELVTDKNREKEIETEIKEHSRKQRK